MGMFAIDANSNQVPVVIHVVAFDDPSRVFNSSVRTILDLSLWLPVDWLIERREFFNTRDKVCIIWHEISTLQQKCISVSCSRPTVRNISLYFHRRRSTINCKLFSIYKKGASFARDEYRTVLQQEGKIYEETKWVTALSRFEIV